MEDLKLYLHTLWLGSDTVIIIMSYLIYDYNLVFLKGIKVTQGRFQHDAFTLFVGST